MVNPSTVKLVFLKGDFHILQQRLLQQPGHFMKAGMLESQFAALEPPRDGVLTLNVVEPPDMLVARIRDTFGL